MRVDVAQHQIGVGNRWPLAPLRITSGPWIGSGAQRPDLKSASPIHPCDTAAACPDRVNVDRRNANWHFLDAHFFGYGRLTGSYQADVKARTAHINCYHVL